MLQQIAENWQGLERRQQISLIALAVVIVGGLVTVGTWATRPSWAVLYSDLSPQDAQAVVEQLEEQGVSHRLADGGSTIQVPQQRLYELRIQLAGEGLPTSSTVGFELFDKTSFSSSELQNNVNLQRALQGELVRSICTLDKITSARVHLALPEERLFTESQEAPSASVVVGLSAARLSVGEVTAISQLVGSAVPSLDPDAVTVVDTAGRVLSGGAEGAAGLHTMAQIEATRNYETSLRRHLQSMLDSVLGANKSVVRVQAALDFQRRERTQETLEPATGPGLVQREEITREQYDGSDGSEVGGPAGLTGTTSSEGSPGRGSYEHTHEVREYNYSRAREQSFSPPGTLQRLAVAVVIDERLASSVETQVRQLVEAAAGIDDTRGDVVTVESMAIDAIKVAEESAEKAQAAEAQRARHRSIQTALRYGGVILLLAMVAAAMVMFSRTIGSAKGDGVDQMDEDTQGASDAQMSPQEQTPDDEEDLDFSSMSFEELQAQTETGDDRPGSHLASQLSELSVRSPEQFARHLTGWLSESENGDGAEDDES